LNPYALRRRNLKTEGNEASTAIEPDSAGIVKASQDDPTPSRAVPPRVAAASEEELALIEKIAAAELAGRKTVADALALELERHRAQRAAGNVVALGSRRPRGGA
jgi:hypothetical protein